MALHFVDNDRSDDVSISFYLGEKMNRSSETLPKLLSETKQNLFQIVPVGLALVQLDGIVVEANAELLSMLEYTAEEFAGKELSELFHPDDKFRSIKHFESLLAGNNPDYPFENRCLTGESVWRWVSVRATLIQDENNTPQLVVVGVEDIHSRRSLEMEQERSTNETNALFAATKTALSIDNFSDAARSIYDQCRILIGATCGYVALLSEDKTENEVLFLETGGLTCTVDPSIPMPIRGLRADAYHEGRPVYHNDFDSSQFPSFLPNGHVTLNNVLFAPLIVGKTTIGLMGFAQKTGGFTSRDVRIAAAFGDLIALVLRRHIAEEKSHKLQAAITQSDRLSSMGRLAAGICHELNNPLSYTCYSFDSIIEDLNEIKSAAEALRAHKGQAPPECCKILDHLSSCVLDDDIQKRLHLAQEGLFRIKEITNSLSAFSLSEREEIRPVFLESAIEAAINLALYEIKYRAKLVREFNAVPTILASPGRLAQCILNLLLNAAEAISPGGVNNNTITIRTFAKDNRACLQVTDTGAGISPANISKIYDPFFTTKDATGAGLGLATCKNIVTELEGNIAIESTLEEGTTVTLLFPIHKEKITRFVEQKLDEMEFPPVSGRILLIDDEEGIRIALKRILRTYTIVESSSGKDAIELLTHDADFDLILCDLMMPNTSGIDVHKWLSEHIPQLAADVMFMTGGIFTDNAKKYLQHIDNVLIDKPFNRKFVQQIVNSHLAEKQKETTN
ncbi:MAG: GAF domain-containing protein [Deltaproteobacteria bacterium]|nr:GAF domain-containing protein [Deltaproteobacteria bacterium]MBN2672328.1 GAF domain-containing protein [Deltaproteobacteria bacterium]